MPRKNKIKQEAVAQALQSTLLLVLLLSGACVICLLLRAFDGTAGSTSMVFVLAVFLVARFTKGYLYGIIASLLGVMAVNFIFTYPFFAFNFTLSGYPVAVFSMLVVSIITSMLTSQTKKNENIRIEAEKEKTRSNLLRAVSHDLRTPLTGIYGATSAMIENNDTLPAPQRLALLHEVQDDAQWLIRMVENLLAVTRIHGETRAEIIKQPEAVEELVSEAVSKFKKRFPEQSVSVRVPNELLMVPMDAMLIQQVLINLLENAVLHGKQPGVEGALFLITLCVQRMAQEAVFEVKDNGAGIAPDVLPKIFEGGFEHTDTENADRKRNMGIGLSVCNTIIKAHGGSMRARNVPQGGAAFCFTLPLPLEE